MEITLVRHATLRVDVAGRRLLVDPMFAETGPVPPVANSPNQRPNWMDAINHCLVRRSDLAAALDRSGLAARVAIPQDGGRIPAPSDPDG
jgi:hypothetical protein